MATAYFGHTSARQLQAGVSAEANAPLDDQDASTQTGEEVITAITVPDHIGLDEQLSEFRTAYRIHAGDQPAWVSTADEFLQEALARSYQCDRGEPKEWGVKIANEPARPQVEPDVHDSGSGVYDYNETVASDAR